MNGHGDGSLSSKGIKQVSNLAARLSNIIFSQFYCSDLGRTKQTCNIILQQYYNKCIKLEYTNLIREKSAGILQGQPIGTHEKLAQQNNIPMRKYCPQNGESWNDMLERSKLFINLLVENHLINKNKQQNQMEENDKTIEAEFMLANENHIQEEEKIPKPNKYAEKTSNLNKQNLNQNNPQKYEKNRILAISHGGFMMEFRNAVFLMKGKPIVHRNTSKNTSIDIYYFKCRKCQGVCYKCASPDLEIELGIQNDDSHITNSNKVQNNGYSGNSKSKLLVPQQKSKIKNIVQQNQKKNQQKVFAGSKSISPYIQKNQGEILSPIMFQDQRKKSLQKPDNIIKASSTNPIKKYTK